jgi:hypothetical protein
MFIGYKEEKIINLNNVSNIYIDERDDGSGKIIFNMNYSVKIFDGKYTPDYVYWNFENSNELVIIRDMIEDKIKNNKKWIMPLEFGQRYVNLNCVSSIVIDITKNRVIFNLNYNVTHPKDNSKLTSDFIFFNFNNYTKFSNFKNTLKNL